MSPSEPSTNIVAHPAMLGHKLDEAEEALYTDVERARALAQGVIDASQGRGPGDAARIRAETLLVILEAQSGRCMEAIHSALHLVDEATAAGHEGLAARLHNVLGAAYDLLELPERAVRHYGRCLGQAQLIGDAALQAKAETNLGVAWSRMGDDQQALVHFRRALDLRGEEGSPTRLGRLYLDISISHRKLGDLDGAAEALSEARRQVLASGHRRSLPQLLLQEGLVLGDGDDPTAGLPKLEEAARVAQEEQLAHVVTRALVAQSAALRAGGSVPSDPTRAVALSEAAVAAAREQDNEVVTCDALEELSRSLERAGRPTDALEAHRELLERRERSWRRRDEANTAALRVVNEVETLQKEREILRETNQRLRSLNQEKAEIMAIVGHDLRSPLTLVTMLADQLREEGSALDRKRAGAILQGCGDRMLGVLDRLLTTDALERGAVVPQLVTVDAAEAAARALSSLQLRALHKGVVLRQEGARPAWASADRTGLDQIVFNLVDNAVKFSSRGGEVVVRTEVSEAGVDLLVLDRGPGFTEADLQAAFHKFARLSARPTDGEPSHGLGLYVVRRMAEELGGHATAENRPGGGAMLRVRLPLGEAARGSGGSLG